MIDLTGYDDVQGVLPGEFSSLPAGGYVCRVCSVELSNSKAGNLMLVLYLDIAEGEFAGFFKAQAERVKSFNKVWDNAAIYRQLVFDKDGKTTSRFFKGLLSCFEQSNQGFVVRPASFDEQSLRNTLCGFVFSQEEYRKSDGSIKTRVFAKFPKLVEDIRNGNFSIPPLRKLQTPTPSNSSFDFPGSVPVDPDDIPF